MNEQLNKNGSYKWKFFRSGGFDQVRIETGADLLELETLDQKLWAALCCPTGGLEFDTRTFALLDTDSDGRIRAPEIIQAIKWSCSILKNSDDLTKGLSYIPLNSINDELPEGKQILLSARQILSNIGKQNETNISIEDIADLGKIFLHTKFNGDGIVTPEASDNPEIKTIIKEIIDCFGSETDLSELQGISQEKSDIFFREANLYYEWWNEAHGNSFNILPLADETLKGYDLFKAVEAKIDDYFMRCSLIEFDPSASLNPNKEVYISLSTQDISLTKEHINRFPLARIQDQKQLPLTKGLNPIWHSQIRNFYNSVINPLFGEKDNLTIDQTSGNWLFLII